MVTKMEKYAPSQGLQNAKAGEILLTAEAGREFSEGSITKNADLSLERDYGILATDDKPSIVRKLRAAIAKIDAKYTPRTGQSEDVTQGVNWKTLDRNRFSHDTKAEFLKAVLAFVTVDEDKKSE